MGFCKIRITRNRDKKQAKIEFEHAWPRDEECATEYLWTDGNYGCDCTRRIFFNEHNGLATPDNARCGSGGFSITVFDENGNVLYDELAS